MCHSKTSLGSTLKIATSVLQSLTGGSTEHLSLATCLLSLLARLVNTSQAAVFWTGTRLFGPPGVSKAFAMASQLVVKCSLEGESKHIAKIRALLTQTCSDTGYRSVPPGVGPEKQYDDDYLSSLPHCPAFKEIGDKIGPFDLSLIPIGAYTPRWFMSGVHCSPEDAVCVHEDVKSKKSVRLFANIRHIADFKIDWYPLGHVGTDR